jgi:acetyl-CoA carboxylase biotin carboxyl carrier protein
MGLTDDDVREILRIIDESELDELRIETPDFRLHVRRAGAPMAEPAAEPPPAPAREAPPARAPAAPAEDEAPAPAPSSDGSANGVATIEAPMLGTFYRASAPGEEPFVDVGSQVDPDTVVCLIEVMKMMNSVKAGVSGTVVEVCARNAELVEYGEPLFRVDPAA